MLSPYALPSERLCSEVETQVMGGVSFDSRLSGRPRSASESISTIAYDTSSDLPPTRYIKNCHPQIQHPSQCVDGSCRPLRPLKPRFKSVQSLPCLTSMAGSLHGNSDSGWAPPVGGEEGHIMVGEFGEERLCSRFGETSDLQEQVMENLSLDALLSEYPCTSPSETRSDITFDESYTILTQNDKPLHTELFVTSMPGSLNVGSDYEWIPPAGHEEGVARVEEMGERLCSGFGEMSDAEAQVMEGVSLDDLLSERPRSSTPEIGSNFTFDVPYNPLTAKFKLVQYKPYLTPKAGSLKWSSDPEWARPAGCAEISSTVGEISKNETSPRSTFESLPELLDPKSSTKASQDQFNLCDQSLNSIGGCLLASGDARLLLETDKLQRSKESARQSHTQGSAASTSISDTDGLFKASSSQHFSYSPAAR